jgi:hypothetical protein
MATYPGAVDQMAQNEIPGWVPAVIGAGSMVGGLGATA